MNIISRLLKISSHIKIAQMLPFGYIPKKDFGPFKGGKIYIGLMPVPEIREGLEYSRADILDDITPQELEEYLKKPIVKEKDLIFNFVDPTKDTDFWGHRTKLGELNANGFLIKTKKGIKPYSYGTKKLREIVRDFVTAGGTFKTLDDSNISLDDIKAELQKGKTPAKTEVSLEGPSQTMIETSLPDPEETWPGATIHGETAIDPSEVTQGMSTGKIPEKRLKELREQIPESSFEVAEIAPGIVSEKVLQKIKKEPRKLFSLGEDLLRPDVFDAVYGALVFLRSEDFSDSLDLLALDFISAFKDLIGIKRLEPGEQKKLHGAFNQILQDLEEKVTGPQRENLRELADDAYGLAENLLGLIRRESRKVFTPEPVPQLERIASLLRFNE